MTSSQAVTRPGAGPGDRPPPARPVTTHGTDPDLNVAAPDSGTAPGAATAVPATAPAGREAAAAGRTDPAVPSAAQIRAGSRWLRWRHQVIELLKFGTVGGVAYVVDVGIMNFLRFGPGEILGDKALTAKVISVAVATMVAWVGNRHWTFSSKKRDSRSRELVWFLLVNAGGMLIAVGTLGISHYVLGLTSPLADNISANVIGLGLGTAFRYFCYRYLVFNGQRNAPVG